MPWCRAVAVVGFVLNGSCHVDAQPRKGIRAAHDVLHDDPRLAAAPHGDAEEEAEEGGATAGEADADAKRRAAAV